MSSMYINYGSFSDWATKVDSRNSTLLEELQAIEKLINSLEGEWESNSAVKTREKITAMEPRFQQYHDVVANYATFLRNTAAEFEAAEAVNTSNAEQFT
ncbi:MAG: WXG100 family type VII secretion target [Lachnospiraceae bacterium]|nr:WXG100 family type VII secretion target [Lachnospiraceae bacterium]